MCVDEQAPGAPGEATRVLARRSQSRSSLEALVLLSSALEPARAPALLEGLAQPQRALAQKLGGSLLGRTSSERHGRLLAVFARPPVSAAGLSPLFQDAGPVLQALFLERLPEGEWPSEPIGMKSATTGAAPLTRRLAARMVEEARWGLPLA